MIHRRSFLKGLIAAPVVVKAASLMPIRGIIMPIEPYGIGPMLAATEIQARINAITLQLGVYGTVAYDPATLKITALI